MCIGQLPPGAADYTSFTSDPAIPSNLKAQLTSAITPSGTADIQASATSGIQAVAAGGDLTNPTEIQGGFALASAGALALGAGMSIAAAVPVMVPIAAIVFGGGVGISSLMRSVFHISDANTSQIYACTPEDTSNGTSPSDPKWKRGFSPSLYDNFGAGSPPNWQPATNGKFETWARPILMRAEDGYLNCQPPPGVQQISSDDLQKAVSAGDITGVGKLNDYYDALWQLGAIKAWNDSNPGAPMRSVSLDPSIPFGDPRGRDVIQLMLWRFRRTLSQYASQYASGAPISIQVADPSSSSGSVGAVAKHAAVVAGGGVAAGLVYAWATGKAIDAVFGNAWSTLSRWGGDAIRAVEGKGFAAERRGRRRR